MNGICDTHQCGAPASVQGDKYENGEQYEWCSRCSGELQTQIHEVRAMIATAREFEASLKASQ